MKAFVQIVKDAKVIIDHKINGQIDYGLTVYFGVEDSDTLQDVERFAAKLLKLRIFDDENGKINRSVLDENGKIMVISNFTLMADLSQNRPSFFKAGKPEHAKKLYEHLITTLQKSIVVAHGEFGANMQIEQTVLGPMNIPVYFS